MSSPIDMTTCPLHEVDTFDPEFLQNPHPFYRRLREEAPVYRDPKNGIIYVSTYAHVMEALAKPRIFSNGFARQLRAGASDGGGSAREREISARGWQPADTLLTADPPIHTRYKKLAGRAFTQRRVATMSAYVDSVIHELLDGFTADGRCEFKSQFANLLPMYVICDALGFDRAHRERFRAWSDAFTLQLSGMANADQRIWCAEQILEAQHYFVEVCDQRRRAPQDDVCSDLVMARLEVEAGEERPLSPEELISVIQQIFVAGNETTSHTLTTGIYYLLTNPEALERLRSRPALVGNFVEECLRMLTPTNNMWRVATEKTELGGVPIAKGDLLLLRFGSANRDEAKFPDGDRFDIERENAQEQIAFGAGVHLCLGQLLARKEMQQAFPIVLERLPNMRLLDPPEHFRYVPSILLRGVERLELAFDPC